MCKNIAMKQMLAVFVFLLIAVFMYDMFGPLYFSEQNRGTWDGIVCKCKSGIIRGVVFGAVAGGSSGALIGGTTYGIMLPATDYFDRAINSQKKTSNKKEEERQKKIDKIISLD